MKIRRFIADNLQEAIRQARIELGQDAIILHTRKFKQGGFMGLFGKPRVEITVALDEVPRVVETGLVPPEVLSAPPAAASQGEAPADSDGQADLLYELKTVKELVTQLNEKIGERDKLKGLPRSTQAMYKRLLRNNVDEKLALRLVRSVGEQLESENTRDQERCRELFIQGIENLIRKPRPIEFNKNKPRVVAMVGPTGVGKTTTIAKLAANFTLLEKKQVGLITIDTYRIAAVEQLKTYAEIIGIPLEVVFRPEGLMPALDKFRHKDLIFIDTAGRSPKNEPQISELAEFLKAARPDEIMLVLSTNTHTADLLDIYRRFNVVRIDKLVFTKLDESNTWGQILNTVHKTRTSLAYITNGQNVPDDIEVPDPFYLAKTILGEDVG